jgi:hypothetical protein
MSGKGWGCKIRKSEAAAQTDLHPPSTRDQICIPSRASSPFRDAIIPNQSPSCDPICIPKPSFLRSRDANSFSQTSAHAQACIPNHIFLLFRDANRLENFPAGTLTCIPKLCFRGIRDAIFFSQTSTRAPISSKNGHYTVKFLEYAVPAFF